MVGHGGAVGVAVVMPVVVPVAGTDDGRRQTEGEGGAEEPGWKTAAADHGIRIVDRLDQVK